jgi:hypothetical protein
MSDPRALVKGHLAAFESHKKQLLETLAEGRRQKERKAPFDAEGYWKDLMRAAEFYFWDVHMRENTPPSDLRVKDLTALRQNLSEAWVLLRKNDVVIDLMRAIFYTGRYQSSKATWAAAYDAAPKILSELQGAAAHLRKLEAAASQAATDARRKAGRPQGSSTIPSEYIIILAELFRRATGRIPGAGPGPFASFVAAFLDAVGRSIAFDTVSGLIKPARKVSLAGYGGGRISSPFRR